MKTKALATYSLDIEVMQELGRICKVEGLNQSAVLNRLAAEWLRKKKLKGYTVEICACGVKASSKVWGRWGGVCPECRSIGKRRKQIER